MKHSPTLIVAAACVVTVLLRVADSPVANLSALGALTLLCAAVLRHPAALLIPIGVRALTDVILELRTGYGFYDSIWFDYAALVLIFALGFLVHRRNYLSVVTGGLAAAVTFFLVSNFGVWLAWPETYPTTVAGLVSCYTNAIPFARGTFLGDVVFSLIFFGAWNIQMAFVNENEAAGSSETV